MLGPLRTITIFTHVQPHYDNREVARRACEKIIRSGLAGEIVEHRVDCYPAWLAHSGRVHQTPSWISGLGSAQMEARISQAYDGLPLAETKRFILCGGSLPMPPGKYRPGHTGAGTCHHIAFRLLLDRLLPWKRPVEFHFPADAIYCMQFPNGDEGKIISLNPKHDPDSLLAYAHRLDRHRVPYNYFHGRDEARGYRPGGLTGLFFWESTDLMLESFR
jgi:hypothetical protein